jgi:hypothetical protein
MYKYTEKQLKWLNDNGFEFISGSTDCYQLGLLTCTMLTIKEEIIYFDLYDYCDNGIGGIGEIKSAINKYYDLACEWEKLRKEK